LNAKFFWCLPSSERAHTRSLLHSAPQNESASYADYDSTLVDLSCEYPIVAGTRLLSLSWVEVTY